jgi:hypothetical protein
VLGRGTLQLKIQQENQENIILIIDNFIYAPDCPIRLISPHQLDIQSNARGYDNSCFTTDETTATLYHGGDTLKCEYHPKTKIPTISCLTVKTAPTQHIQSTSMAKQPNHTGRKQFIFHDTHQITTPAAYSSNINTAQQELLRLHETYAHADMQEIQQQIKNCDIKANIQVATCQIPKCFSCSKKKAITDHTNNIADPSRKATFDQDLTHRLIMWTQQM